MKELRASKIVKKSAAKKNKEINDEPKFIARLGFVFFLRSGSVQFLAHLGST